MTTTLTRSSAPAPRLWDRWRYRDDGGRDLRLDLVRGYALAAMSINHLGLSESLFHRFSGRSSFLISAAEVFLFVSGFTLGWISAGRQPGVSEARLWRRAWILYLATTGVTVAMILVALHTDLALWAGFEAGEFAGPLDALGRVATLRLAVGGVDILVAYVLYLLAAVVAVRAMERGRSWAVAGVVAVLYGLSQLAPPEAFGLGFASFRVLVPNAPLFFGGLLLGYHRTAVVDAWRRVPGYRALDGLTVAAAVMLAVLHARGWQDWPWLGDVVTAGNPEEPLWVRESELPLWPLLVVGLYLRAVWLLVDRAWRPLERLLGRLVLPLGEAALFTFVAHLVAIPVFLNLPGFPSEDEVSVAVATVWVGAFVLCILAAVHVRQRMLVWLRAGTPGREWVRGHGPLVAVGVLVVGLLVPVAPGGQSGPWGEPEFDEELEEELEEEFEGEFDDPES